MAGHISKACCANSQFEPTKASVCHITQLFLLFIGDEITDLIVIFQWYRYGYRIWFIIAAIIMCISWLMQWLYCTWNCNSYLQNLLKHLNYSSFFHSSLKKTNLSQSQCKNKNKLCILSGFLFKSLIFHLLFHGGIFELYVQNIYYYNKKMLGSFIDLLNLHCVFQSVLMFAVVLLFCFHNLFFSDFQSNNNLNIILLHLLSLTLSFISSCIFTVNFEKFRYIPLYHVCSWQFSKHNIIALYTLFTGDVILRFVPFLIFTSFYYILYQTQSIFVFDWLFILCAICICIQFVLCFLYHTMCWYKFGFLRLNVWTYQHLAACEYQIINPLLSICDISAIFSCIMHEILFIYASVLLSNISIMAHIYFKPVMINKQNDAAFLSKCVRCECFIRYCLGVIILFMLLIEAKKYDNLPPGLQILCSLDVILLILSLLSLLFNTMLVYNLSDSPAFHVELFHINYMQKNRFNRHLYHSNDKNMNDENKYLILAQNNKNINTEISMDDKNASKMNICLRYLIKMAFSNHQIKCHKSDIQPWAGFAMREKWKLHPMGFWQRLSKNEWNHKQIELDIDEEEDEYLHFDEDEAHKYAANNDPFYTQFEIMQSRKQEIRKRKTMRFLANISYVSYEYQWRQWYVAYLENSYNGTKKEKKSDNSVVRVNTDRTESFTLNSKSTETEIETVTEEEHKYHWDKYLKFKKNNHSYQSIPSISKCSPSISAKITNPKTVRKQKHQSNASKYANDKLDILRLQKKRSSNSKSVLSASIPEHEQVNGD